MEAAIMPRATSVLDQMARSTEPKRKSCDRDNRWIELMRIKVAMLPIFARHRIKNTETFVRKFMFKPRTIKAGRIVKVQSPREATAAWAYVKLTVTLLLMQ